MNGSAGRFVVAYHGCDRATMEAVVAGSAQLQPSRNAYDWLGGGVYFFEDDWPRARHFAEASAVTPARRLSAKSIVHPAVLGVILRLENWLDLSTQAGIDEFVTAYEGFAIAIAAEGRRMPVNKAASLDDDEMILHNLDRAVIKFLHEARAKQGLPQYQAVRGAFTQGAPVVPTSAIRRQTHVQIAVRDMRCVVGYFRVPEASGR